MPFCYSNNGLSMRAVDPSYVAQSGEVLFPDDFPPSTLQLSAAFPGYAAAALVISNAVICDEIDAFRDARLEAGFVDVAPASPPSPAPNYTGKTWQCDPTSCARWVGLAVEAMVAIQAGAGTTTTPMIAGDNTITQISYSDCYALLAQRVAPWVQATIVYGRTMKNAVLANNPPADYTQGWP